MASSGTCVHARGRARSCREQFQEEGWLVRKEGRAGAVRLTLTRVEQAWCRAPGRGGTV